MSTDPEKEALQMQELIVGEKNKSFLKKCYAKMKDTFNKNKQNSLIDSVNELIRERTNDDSIAEDEREMLENFVSFRDIKVSEIMVPRTDIVGISANSSFSEVITLVQEDGHTRFPVYKDSLDQITGFIHVKDLIQYIVDPKDFSIAKILRELVYAPRSMKVTDLLSKMRQGATHIAIVLDEYGGTDGLVTIEDMVEEIIGEIKDEHDDKIEDLYIISSHDGSFQIDARAKVEDVEEVLGVSLSEEDGEYETFGGFILSYLGYIPKVGENIKYAELIEISIKEADERKIKKAVVKMTGIEN